MDENFYHSLRFKYEFRKNNWPKHPYRSQMAAEDSYYFPNDIETINDNLRKK